jgi:hypothetical protein
VPERNYFSQSPRKSPLKLKIGGTLYAVLSEFEQRYISPMAEKTMPLGKERKQL